VSVLRGEAATPAATAEQSVAAEHSIRETGPEGAGDGGGSSEAGTLAQSTPAQPVAVPPAAQAGELSAAAPNSEGAGAAPAATPLPATSSAAGKPPSLGNRPGSYRGYGCIDDQCRRCADVCMDV
jgi:hypothetical protein